MNIIKKVPRIVAGMPNDRNRKKYPLSKYFLYLIKFSKAGKVPQILTSITAFLTPIIGVIIGIKTNASPNPIIP